MFSKFLKRETSGTKGGSSILIAVNVRKVQVVLALHYLVMNLAFEIAFSPVCAIPHAVSSRAADTSLSSSQLLPLYTQGRLTTYKCSMALSPSVQCLYQASFTVFWITSERFLSTKLTNVNSFSTFLSYVTICSFILLLNL